jgi:hypothetical protein
VPQWPPSIVAFWPVLRASPRTERIGSGVVASIRCLNSAQRMSPEPWSWRVYQGLSPEASDLEWSAVQRSAQPGESERSAAPRNGVEWSGMKRRSQAFPRGDSLRIRERGPDAQGTNTLVIIIRVPEHRSRSDWFAVCSRIIGFLAGGWCRKDETKHAPGGIVFRARPGRVGSRVPASLWD